MPRDYDRINYWAWRVTLALPEGHGKTIATANGQVVLGLAGNDVVVVDDAVKKINQPLVAGGQTFTITDFSLLEGIMNVQVKRSLGAASDRPTDAKVNDLPFSVTILDAVDKEGWSATGRDAVSGHFSMFQLRLPLKLKLTVPTKTKEAVVQIGRASCRERV